MHSLRRNVLLGGVLLVVVGIASVQLGAAIAKSMFDVMSPEGMTFLRLGFAAIVMVAIARPRLRGHGAQSWLWMIVFGVTLAGMNLMFYLSMERIPLGVAVTIELLGPLTLAMVQTRRLVDFLWVLLAVSGLAIVGVQSFQGTLDPIGVLLAAAAGVCWAIYIVASQRTGANVHGVGGLAIAMVIAALVVAPFGLFSAISSATITPMVLLPALGVALLSSAVPYAAELVALRRIPSRVFRVLMSLEPASAALFAFLLLRETVSLWEGVAIVLVILASAGVAVTAARGVPKPSTGIIETINEPPREQGPIPPTP